MDLNIPGLDDVIEIGRGGFATVYRAYQPAFRRTVAVKVLNATNLDELSQERFRRECQAMGLLSEHPNIVTVLDAGFLESGQAYMVMPFMPAGSLQDKVQRDGPMPWAEASRVGVKLAGALHAAHNAGVIHRDVKPANVLVSEYGETKLADFGIARVSGAGETQSGVVTASIAFAPPEVIEGKRPTVQSDIYSLGATVYGLVAGHPPFAVGKETSLGAILLMILNEEPEDFRTLGVPDPFAEVVAKAMSKDPEARHESAAMFGREVRLAQDELGIKPTELTILKVETPLLVARSDASMGEATAGVELDEAEVETIAATATSPAATAPTPQQVPVDDEATRDVPVVTETPTQVEASSPPATRLDRLRRKPLLTIAALAGIAVVVVGVAVMTSGGDASLPGGEAPVAEDNPAVVAEGYIPPVVNDPLNPPPISDVGHGNPLELAYDHETARISQCPEGLVRDLTGEDLRSVSWRDRDLRCTDFRGANLTGADLSGSLLWGSDFTGLDLRDVEFGTELAQFQATVLVDTDMRGLSLPDVDWSFANLSGANLDGAELPPFSGGVVLSNTTCPDGSNSNETDCGRASP